VSGAGGHGCGMIRGDSIMGMALEAGEISGGT
jgi:hypothetical protein